MSASFSEGISKSEDEPRSAAVEELEERIIKLESDLVEMKTKYEEELEMEKVIFLYSISWIHGDCGT